MNREDRIILRECAKKQMEYANSDENQSKINRWYRHNSMQGEPMVVAEICGIFHELDTESELVCKDETARSIELTFRRNFLMHEFIGDDSVIDPYFRIQWDIDKGSNGVDVRVVRSQDNDGREFGMEIDAPIADLRKGLEELEYRKYSVDRGKTIRYKTFLEELFGDILPVRIFGDYWWTMGLSHHLIYLIGHERFMLSMYDDPEALHWLMEFVYKDRLAQVKWMESNRLLNLNNENNYIGSGGRGFTKELGQSGDTVSSTDMWALLESQPTSHVSPEMFREFVFDYQLRMAENFGLIYYGCCEPLHDRMDLITRIPNLRSVSVSPFSDERIMSEYINGKYIYSRKPDPAVLSNGNYSSEAIEKSIEKTLKLAKGCELEFIMKDLHTVGYERERLREWVLLTRQAIENHYH